MEYLETKDVNMKSFRNDDVRWKPFLRQVLVASSTWTIYFCLGMVFGSPTVVIPQLRRANVTVTDDMASWLSSTFSYAAIPWVIILTTFSRIVGRKKTSIFTSLVIVISFIVFYFSITPTHLLITEAFFGVPQAAVISVTIIVISEYTSPKYRGIFLCVKSASYFWGIWLSNAIGTFTFWRYIPVIGFTFSLYTLTAFFWPESPYWLASKNRFAECRKAHRWLKGKSEAAEEELHKIIEANTDCADKRFTFNDLSRREFFLPLFVSLLAVIQYQFSGKFVITIYAIDIIKKIVKDESTVYTSMLILDGVTVFSAYVGCFLAKYFKRRTIWFSTSSLAISFLLILSLYLYLVKLSVISENVYLSIFFLSGFSMSISCGPMILATSLYGELLPCRYKNITSVIIGVEHLFLHGTLLKVAPSLIESLHLHGAILFYALSSSLCLCLMYFYLPETKDKTLLEIEEYFKERTTVEECDKLFAKINIDNKLSIKKTDFTKLV